MSSCLVTEPYNSRTFRSSDFLATKAQTKDHIYIENSKKDAWERHRSTWGTAIYEDPIQGATHKDMNKLKHVMNTAKLPPCSLKGHRHFGAPSEPMSLLVGSVDTTEKGSSKIYRAKVEREVMGYGDYGDNTASQQRKINHQLNSHGAYEQLHTQACLDYMTHMDLGTGKSTMASDYTEHKTAFMYQSLPAGGINADSLKTPFASKAKRQQDKYNKLMKGYYKDLSGKTRKPPTSPSKSSRSALPTRCHSTTPTQEVKRAQPTRRSRSAMLRAVSEATSTSEVSCSLAVLPGSQTEKTKTRGEKLTSKVTDAIANRQMNLKRSDLFVKPDLHVPPVQYFISETRATQTDSGILEGLNPLWPPSNKSQCPDKIGYPHLRLPLAIDTLNLQEHKAVEGTCRDQECQTPQSQPRHVHFSTDQDEPSKLPNIRTNKMTNCVKSDAHKAFTALHKSDWVPRIWDYNYLLFHLDRRDNSSNGQEMMSCHGSHLEGLLG